ncbi:MAG: hypothetical protein ACKV2V_30755 [Blastocatellia bacterium]
MTHARHIHRIFATLGLVLALTWLIPAGISVTNSAHTQMFRAALAEPILTLLNPATVNAGNGNTILTVEGTDFTSGSVIRWNGSDRPTSFVSATQLTMVIPAADLSIPTQVSVTVFTPGAAGGTSNALTFSITGNNPVPALTTLDPPTIAAGSAGFTLNVNGTGFVSGATVRWNSGNKRTTYVSATRLSASISAADVAAAGTASVSVLNPAPGGGLSGTVTFTISSQTNPAPVISGLSPNSTVIGSDDLVMTVNGSNFVSGAIIRWNNVDRPTTFVSSSQLSTLARSEDLLAAGTANITVFNPAPGGGLSNTATFQIVATNPAPTLTALAPAHTLFGGPDFTLTATGTSFVTGAVIRWNGADRATTFVGATHLTATITAADIQTAGSASVTVFNPAPGGGVSGAQTFTISALNPVPAVTTISPNMLTAGGATFLLTVNGTGFASNTVIRWNTVARRTTFVSDKQLTTLIPGSLLSLAGTAQVSVQTPAPGGGNSNDVTFTITETNPLPVISAVSPDSVIAGAASLTLTVTGSNFVNGAALLWNDVARPTTYVSPTQLTAAIPGSDLTTTGAFNVNVRNPAPGGGLSGALTVNVTPPPNPLPAITAIAPVSNVVFGNDFTLTVNGSDFVPVSVIRWNGSDRPTTYVSATQVRAVIPELDLGAPGIFPITVFNPTPGGGLSNAINFSVTTGNPIPTLTLMTPSLLPSGSGAFTLIIKGLSFVNGASVRWNGATRRTTYISPTEIRATIQANDLAQAGTAAVTVLNPPPEGGISNALTFNISSATNPAPTLSALSPAVVATRSGDFTLTVTGINFAQNSVVRVNGQERTTTYVSNGTLTAAIPGTDIQIADSLIITVFSPAPGGGTSNTVFLRVVNQVVNVSAANFKGASLASESIVSAFGSGLATATRTATALPLPKNLGGTTVVVRDAAGVAREAPLFFVSPTQINYQLPPGTVTGAATVTVNSADGATASATLNIVPVAPAIFTADATGQGLPAATILRAVTGGAQTHEPVGMFDATSGHYIAMPIDLSRDNEEVHLILYGTGLRAHTSLANVTASIGGLTVPVQFAGQQGTMVGLDQVNILLPKSLRGKGEAAVTLIADGIAANTVKVMIK